MTKLDIVSQIADLKEIDYKNTLAIASIIEILIDKGVINKEDISHKARELENLTLGEAAAEAPPMAVKKLKCVRKSEVKV